MSASGYAAEARWRYTRCCCNGLAWAGLPAEKLAGGSWSVLPGKSRPEDDAGVAAQLQRDLDAIKALLRI